MRVWVWDGFEWSNKVQLKDLKNDMEEHGIQTNPTLLLGFESPKYISFRIQLEQAKSTLALEVGLSNQLFHSNSTHFRD